MKKKILICVLCLFSLVVAGGAWSSLSRAVLVTGSSVWLVPMLWFALFYFFFSLQFVLLGKSGWAKLTLIASLSLGLFFVREPLHFVVLAGVGFLLWLSNWQVNRDLEESVRISPVKALYSGRVVFILALSLAISSQYYFQASASGLLKMPVFDVGEFLSHDWTKKIFFALNPEWKTEDKMELTVDEYLWENYLASVSQGGAEELSVLLPSGQKYSAAALEKLEHLKKDQILKVGRDQLEKTAGQALTGEEKMTDVFSLMINNRLNMFFGSGAVGDRELVVPGVMTAALFLTVLSLGSFMAYIVAYLVSLFVWILIKTRVVKVTTVAVEKEVIE